MLVSVADSSSSPFDLLIKALAVINDDRERRCFLTDLCTASEMETMTQRLMVASMLINGQTYISIAEHTGVSTATISRIRRQIDQGQGGIRLVLERLKEMGEIT